MSSSRPGAIPPVSLKFRVLAWVLVATSWWLFEIRRYRRRRLLASADLRDRLELIRRDSEAYRCRRRAWGEIFRDRRVVVVGSAPDFVAPEIVDDDVVVAVNVSSGVLCHHRLRRPDVTLLNTNVFGSRKPLMRKAWAMQTLANQSTEHLILVTGYMGKLFAALVLASIGFRYRRMWAIDRLDRYAITGAVSGEDNVGSVDATNSTGISAVAIALRSGAREVVVCGFSLRGGVGLVDTAPVRRHVASDRRFLELARGRGLPISTTSAELQREVGLPPPT
jgi:hypothetical protein